MRLLKAREGRYFRSSDLTKLTWDPEANLDGIFIIFQSFLEVSSTIFGKKTKMKKLREIYTYIGFRNEYYKSR